MGGLDEGYGLKSPGPSCWCVLTSLIRPGVLGSRDETQQGGEGRDLAFGLFGIAGWDALRTTSSEVVQPSLYK